MCDISFIIPNYNGETLIQSCLDSIYSLGMDESRFEVIVIDDCSTDGSVAVVNGIALAHSNLTLLRQPVNCRQGAARNRGIDVACGEYLTFVDSDDLVGADVVKALDEAVRDKPDVYCGISKDFSKGNPEDGHVFKIITDIAADTFYSGHEFCCAVKDFSGSNGTPWGYFFRRDFVLRYGKRFIEGHLFEETEWIAFHFLKAEKVFFSSKVLYYYYHNPSSVMMSNMGINYVVDSNSLACRMMRLSEDFRYSDPALFEEWNRNVDRNLLSRGIRLRFLIKYTPRDIRRYFREMASEDLDFLNENYRGNRGRELFFRHKYISMAVFAVLCTARSICRKIMRRGPERINFYS